MRRPVRLFDRSSPSPRTQSGLARSCEQARGQDAERRATGLISLERKGSSCGARTHLLNRRSRLPSRSGGTWPVGDTGDEAGADPMVGATSSTSQPFCRPARLAFVEPGPQTVVASAGQSTAIVTRRNVAGIEVVSGCWLLFCPLNKVSNSMRSSPARPFVSAASKAFMVGP